MTLDMIERERYNEGVIDGISVGQASKLVESVENLIKNLDLSSEAACNALGSSIRQYEEAKKLLEQNS